MRCKSFDLSALQGGGQKLASAGSGVGVGSWAATTVVGSDVEIEILLEAHRM